VDQRTLIRNRLSVTQNISHLYARNLISVFNPYPDNVDKMVAPASASKWRMGFNPYPANVDKMVAPASASKLRMGFNPYPANVDKMVVSCQC
jgi:LDH2 family malate/lactate/ureidoglycolate dehydrogenase